MSAFVDTSFLCTIYFIRAETESAISLLQTRSAPPLISDLVIFEFRQAVWFRVWLNEQKHPQGLSEVKALTVLAAFDLDLENGIWARSEASWSNVVARAEKLAAEQTRRLGIRAFDLLHIATAIELGATKLLSFDALQREGAVAAGLPGSPA